MEEIMKEMVYHDAAKAYINNNTRPKFIKEMAGKGYSIEVSINLWKAIDIYEYTKQFNIEDPSTTKQSD